MTNHSELASVIKKLSTIYKVETANPKEEWNLYQEQASDIRKNTPFINDEAYFESLSQYGDMIISGENGISVGVFGFGYWDGMAITDYPLINDAGIYVFADYADNTEKTIFYGFHAFEKNEHAVWISNDVHNGYKPGFKNYLDFLEHISNGNFK